MEIRRHALKLAFWPKSATGPRGQVLDLDWEWVKGMPNNIGDIGELRIDDVIGGYRNLRIIFFKCDHKGRGPMPIIWVLDVFAKKSNEFTKADLTRFKLLRKWALDQFDDC
jgi:hypothetical protein